MLCVCVTAHQLEYILWLMTASFCFLKLSFGSLICLYFAFQRFCSNFCFKASKYFESQISDSPVWTRIGERSFSVVFYCQWFKFLLSPHKNFFLHLLNLPFAKSFVELGKETVTYFLMGSACFLWRIVVKYCQLRSPKILKFGIN